MSYPIAGGPQVGDMVTLMAKVTRVGGGSVVFALPLADDEAEYLRPLDGLTVALTLESFYLSVKSAKRPAPFPKAGDRVVPRAHGFDRGKVLAANGDRVWVEWNDGSHGLHEIETLFEGGRYSLECAADRAMERAA